MNSGKLARFNLRAVNAALASAVALAGVGFGINANAATATGTADARVISPITITAGTGTDALNFGAFSTDAAGQTVQISPAALPVRTPTGVKVVNSAASGSGFSAGKFTVTGDTGTSAVSTTFTLTVPASTEIAISGAGAGDTSSRMTVALAHSAGANPVALGTTAVVFYVGGTLTTRSPQVAGAYSGTYTVTVEYN